jgi:ATP-dependent Clp protease protease subunit
MAQSRRSAGPRRKVTTMMPVSVPKVLMRPPGQRQSEWVDLWEAYVSLNCAALLTVAKFTKGT